MKKKIVTVTGIRPDFIRMSEVFRQLDENFEHILVHTGQHYDPNLSDVFFSDLKIKTPDYNLSIGSPGKTHYEQVADLSVKLTKLCIDIQPDLVVFLGDSNSVLSAIPLHKEGFKIAHIEAGMRSYDRRMLEETNRVACDHVSEMLFVYHDNYKNKLLAENIPSNKIFVVGNTIVEPLRKISSQVSSEGTEHIILDIHRPENFKFKTRMQNIIKFASLFSNEFSIPVKMLKFPRTMSLLSEYDIDLGSIEVIDLLGYKQYVELQKKSLFIFSDSGSAQEEPALLGKPVIVPRDFTERPESMEANCSLMLDVNSQPSADVIQKAVQWIQSHQPLFAGSTEWLGTGQTSELIIKEIKNFFKDSN